MTVIDSIKYNQVDLFSGYLSITVKGVSCVEKQQVCRQCLPCRSSTGVPLQTPVHSERSSLSLRQSRERRQCDHDPADRPTTCHRPLSAPCPTSESAHEYEISSHVHGLGRDQTLALSPLKYNGPFVTPQSIALAPYTADVMQYAGQISTSLLLLNYRVTG